MNHRTLLVMLLMGSLAPACNSPSADSDGMPRDRSPHPSQSQFRLSLIDGVPLQTREQSRRSCNLRPFHGWYILGAGSWSSGDSIFPYCESGAIDSFPYFRSGSGTYRLSGDTIEFFVTDTSVGVRGLVNSGLLHPDTLRIWGSDLDGGDYVFVRNR